jgi:ribosome biogenesis GTPase
LVVSDGEDPVLHALGWDADWQTAADAQATRGAIGRVARVDMGRATVLTEGGAVSAAQGDARAATGDWVIVDGEQVVSVLPRRSVFTRGSSIDGVARDEQIVAANVDLVLLVHSLTSGAKARRLERELVLAFESGATPVVVLNKVDAADAATIEQARDEVIASAAGVEVVLSSARTGEGVERLRELAHGNRTVALVGASGVGKSTLINRLVGADVRETGEVRAGDQRGRHTTTARELVVLPGDGVLVDTPGLRALSLWDADEGLSRAFEDIETLATQCRFSDCSHTVEPGCAVQAAIASGALVSDRLDNYRRLESELDAAERRRRDRAFGKAVRRIPHRP